MPVFFAFPKNPQSQSCNTPTAPETFKIPIGKFSHKLFKETNLVALKPVIDTVAFTTNGKEAFDHWHETSANSVAAKYLLSHGAYWDDIKQRLQLVAKKGGKSTFRHSTRRIAKHTSFDVNLDSTKAVPLLSIPHTPIYGKSSLRIEFNSQTLGAYGFDGLCAAWKELDEGRIPLPAFLHGAATSRIDVAFDILNLNISDIYAHHPDIWKVWSVKAPFGNLETEQHHTKYPTQKHNRQSPKKKAALIVYDKKRELEQDDQRPIFEGIDHVRMEFYFRTGTKLKNLQSWSPNLGGWSVFNLHGPENDQFRRYFDSIRQRGIEIASAMYPAELSTKSELLEHLPLNLFHENVLDDVREALLGGAIGRAAVLAKLPIDQHFKNSV